MPNITPEYEAGGFSTNDGDYMGNSLPEVIGRFWNNVSGVTAANMFNAREAEKNRLFNATEAQSNVTTSFICLTRLIKEPPQT